MNWCALLCLSYYWHSSSVCVCSIKTYSINYLPNTHDRYSLLLALLFTGAAKGDELGLFKYGGSTVVLVFDAARVAFDADLVESAQQGVEVLVKVGTSLAKAQL